MPDYIVKPKNKKEETLLKIFLENQSIDYAASESANMVEEPEVVYEVRKKSPEKAKPMDKLATGKDEVKLALFTFIEDNVHVVYSPALDLYGYGNNEPEAQHSFEVVLDEYVKYTRSEKTIEQDLAKYGWQVDKRNKTLNSPTVSTMLATNESFRDMLNNKLFNKYDLNVQLLRNEAAIH